MSSRALTYAEYTPSQDTTGCILGDTYDELAAKFRCQQRTQRGRGVQTWRGIHVISDSSVCISSEHVGYLQNVSQQALCQSLRMVMQPRDVMHRYVDTWASQSTIQRRIFWTHIQSRNVSRSTDLWILRRDACDR